MEKRDIDLRLKRWVDTSTSEAPVQVLGDSFIRGAEAGGRTRRGVAERVVDRILSAFPADGFLPGGAPVPPLAAAGTTA
jgi:hypothetical protein